MRPLKSAIFLLASVPGSALAQATSTCAVTDVKFAAQHAEVKPINDAVYKKNDGTDFIVTSKENQLLLSIPIEDINRVSFFASERIGCDASISVGDDVEVEKRLLASFLPLTYLGQRDRYISLITEKTYALPFVPTPNRPLIVKITIIGRH